MSSLLKTFYCYTKFQAYFCLFRVFSMVGFKSTVLKVSSSDIRFQDLSHGILYFPVAKKFIDFVIFTCLRTFGNYIEVRNREIWNLLSAMF